MNLMLGGVAVLIVVVILDWWIGIRDDWVRKGFYLVAAALILVGLLDLLGLLPSFRGR